MPLSFYIRFNVIYSKNKVGHPPMPLTNLKQTFNSKNYNFLFKKVIKKIKHVKIPGFFTIFVQIFSRK